MKMSQGAKGTLRKQLTGHRCQTCGKVTPDHSIVHVTSAQRGPRTLCSRCLNLELARQEGLDNFTEPDFEPVSLTDSLGVIHEFSFQVRIGTGITIEGFELKGGERYGYQFEVLGGYHEDLLVLFGRLLAKMRRGLSARHLVSNEWGLHIATDTVRATIASDSARNHQLPLLTIDGQEIGWDEFGRMLMSFEGFQFKLEIRDKSEEI